MGYLSDEILALDPDTVKRFFKNNFAAPRARVVSRRGITFGGKKIILKITRGSAESGAN